MNSFSIVRKFTTDNIRDMNITIREDDVELVGNNSRQKKYGFMGENLPKELQEKYGFMGENLPKELQEKYDIIILVRKATFGFI